MSLESKEYFATKTKDSLSYDSVVYYITSYEIDRHTDVPYARVCITRQRLHACVRRGRFDLPQTIRRTCSWTQYPHSSSHLKTNTDYLNVNWLFNYPVAVWVTGSLIVISIVVWFVFGKRIRRYYKLKRLDKDHVASFILLPRHCSECSRSSHN
ncbi:MAG: hypothetical protein WDO15_23025 [Bacteroidota bacterium]